MLKTENLSLKIQDKFLIENLSLEFHPGKIYGIIGPNGSGKTTLLKALTGIWKATSGKVFWMGENLLCLDRQTISRTITLVPQNAQVYFNFTVEDVVEMGTYPRLNLTNHEKLKLIHWALELVDMWHLRHRPATKISHGERQRMYIARSLVMESPVLILDEPTSNLDIRHQLDIWNLLRGLALKNKIIIVANHDLHAAKCYCDPIIVLNQGQCVASGSFSDVMTPSLISSIFGVKELN